MRNVFDLIDLLFKCIISVVVHVTFCEYVYHHCLKHILCYTVLLQGKCEFTVFQLRLLLDLIDKDTIKSENLISS